MGEETDAKGGLFEEKVEKHTLLCKSPIHTPKFINSYPFPIFRGSHTSNLSFGFLGNLRFFFSTFVEFPWSPLAFSVPSIVSTPSSQSFDFFFCIWHRCTCFCAYLRVIDYLVILLLCKFFLTFGFSCLTFWFVDPLKHEYS